MIFTEILQEFKCPSCGGSVEFDSASQELKCPYCDTYFAPETISAYDKELENEPTDEMEWSGESTKAWSEENSDGVAVYSCASCGGEIVGDEQTAATSCPYCGNPVVITGKLAGDLCPDLVIPFKLDRKAAKEALKKHFLGKKLLPKSFSRENHLDEIKGIYVPFWLFDADTSSSLRYRGTRVSFWSDSRYNYTKTSYYALHRGGALSFENIPVDGSTKMDDALMESLEPYDFSEAVDFRTAYLAGYLADRYNVSAADCTPRVNERIRESVENEFLKTTYRFSSVSLEKSAVKLEKNASKYILLPVWLLSTTWQEKKYIFAMNGQTGKLVGDLPLDKRAFWRWFIGICAGVGAAAFALLSLFWFFM